MAKYYELTPEESAQIGRFYIDDQHIIDATCGKLENGNFAISKKALKGLKKVEGIDFEKKKLKDVVFIPQPEE